MIFRDLGDAIIQINSNEIAATKVRKSVKSSRREFVSSRRLIKVMSEVKDIHTTLK